MSSDGKIPEWVLEAALEALKAARPAYDSEEQYDAHWEAIARALLAAEQRGRKAGLEEAAKVAFDEMFEAVDAIRARKLQTAIRSLGEKI